MDSPPAPPNFDALRALLGASVPDAEVEAVVASYLTLARAVAAFPTLELAEVEPPLRSVPGPVEP